MSKISWVEKKNKPIKQELSNISFVSIYPLDAGNKGNTTSVFKFMNGCNKAITKTTYIKLGVALEQKRLYFAEAYIDDGYKVSDVSGTTANNIAQIRKSVWPDLFDLVTKYKGTYLLKKDSSGIYIELDQNEEKTQKDADEEKHEKAEKADLEMVLSGLNQMYKQQEAILEQLKEQNEILKRMSGDVHSGVEKVKAIFTEVKYKKM